MRRFFSFGFCLVILTQSVFAASYDEATRAAYDEIAVAYDRTNGGFGGAPKYPRPAAISFLLRYGTADAREMALSSMRAMARGAIYDQLGGGFHPYTADVAWRQPHFAKLLIDQALLATAYTEAWQITHDELYAVVARQTLEFTLRELRLENGTFGVSLSSQSLIPGKTGPELVEGAYYLWNRDEIVLLLGAKKADPVLRLYDVKPDTPNILSVRQPHLLRDFREEIAAAQARMLLVRSKRPEPKRDNKVLVGANALMISALARAGAAFGEQRYIGAAEKAANAILERKRAEDSEFLIQGLLDLFETHYDLRWLELAVDLQQTHETAVPSDASIAAMNFLRLAEFTKSEKWRLRAQAMMQPPFTPQMASAALFALATPVQVVMIGEPWAEDGRLLMRSVHERFLPHRIIVAVRPRSRVKLAQYLPMIENLKAIDEKATVYVCQSYVCRSPALESEKLGAMLGK